MVSNCNSIDFSLKLLLVNSTKITFYWFRSSVKLILHMKLTIFLHQVLVTWNYIFYATSTCKCIKKKSGQWIWEECTLRSLNLMLLENGKRFSLGLELKVAAISSKTLTSREVHPRVNFPISGISLYF